MSNYCIYIKVPTFIEQWLRHDYWNPLTGRVEFERGSNLHSILSTFLRKEPTGYVRGDVSGLLPVEVPTFKGMNPDQHNYLGHCGQKALVSAIKRNFKTLLDRELSAFYDKNVTIIDIIYAFMEVHGIENTATNHEAIRQMFKRQRDKNIKSGSIK
ncbi:MAG: hypothetical protein HDS60_03705 [Barnesiella sp.]|nr:hypothetical protein [Barnesiella sp.]